MALYQITPKLQLAAVQCAWQTDLGNGPEAEANAALIVRAVNHADKLAEACRSLGKLREGWTSEQMNYAIRKAQDALAAYEAAQ